MNIACCRVVAVVLFFSVMGGGAVALAGNAAFCAEMPSTARPAARTPQATLKLISVQMNVSATTKEERVTAALKLLEQAADAEGPGIYVLPEYAMCPLPNIAAVAANQEPVPGPITKRFGEVAAKRGLWVAVGMSETSPDPKRPYNAIAIIGPQGQLLLQRYEG